MPCQGHLLPVRVIDHYAVRAIESCVSVSNQRCQQKEAAPPKKEHQRENMQMMVMKMVSIFFFIHFLSFIFLIVSLDRPSKKEKQFFDDDYYGTVTSSSSSSDESNVVEEGQVEVIESLDNFFFSGTSAAIPPLYRSGDTLMLDPSVNTPRDMMMMLMSEKNAHRLIFSRDIRAYEKGTIVSKHCAPWGDFNILHNAVFEILRSVYDGTGQARFVLVRCIDGFERDREFLLEPAFFLGWLDLDNPV